MASAHDVAKYILERQGSVSTWKLQKLVYYTQAWHLVWAEKPLFQDRIEAWANGPVVPALYNQHRGQFSVSKWRKGDAEKLTEREKKTVDRVLEAYGNLSGQQLVRLTHNEGPWLEARQGLASTERSNAQISLESMSAFYLAIDADDNAVPIDQIDWESLA
ncbi:MAG: Panacea domain-containing protein [Solirubrobacterales bacterium]